MITPSLGTEKAKLVRVPAGFVKSIDATNIVIKLIGSPDASGIITEEPVDQVVPVIPVRPIKV